MSSLEPTPQFLLPAFFSYTGKAEILKNVFEIVIQVLKFALLKNLHSLLHRDKFFGDPIDSEHTASLFFLMAREQLL